MGDVTGELFRPFALTVTIAMTASLFVALTIVPVLAYWFLRPGKPILDEEGRQIDPEDPASPPSRLQKSYLPILRWTLKHSWVTLLLAVLVLAGTVALAPLMKTNFLGDSGQNTFTMTQDIGAAPSLEAEDAASEQVEAVLLDIDGIETVQVSIGSSGSALRDAFTGGGSGITYSVTTDPAVDQVALREEVQAEVAELDDAGTITIAGGGGGFGGSDIEIDVTAPDATTLQEATDSVVDAVSDADGIGQVSSNLSASLPYIAVVVDREKAASLGLSEVAVGALVSNTMQPQSIGTVEIDDTALTVYLAASQTPATIDELRQLTVPSASGPIPLQDVATVEESEGPTSITTVGGQRTATVTVTPSTDDLTAASASVNTALAEVDLPDAADASLGGVISQQQDAFTQLGLALLAAILIVYIVMVATFKSLRQPLLLLISVPFAATGAILLQIITGIPLGVASLIGVLMLIGIVVTNAIVLVDLVNQYRTKGLSAYDATIAGGSRRLRPILMTALATIFALTPLALGITGQGGFISQPLAIVVIGGLVSSTVLTLLVLPTLYNLVEGAKERRVARRTGADESDAAADDRSPALVGAGAGAAAQGLTRREIRAREAAAAGGAAGASTVEVPMIEEGPDIETSEDAEFAGHIDDESPSEDADQGAPETAAVDDTAEPRSASTRVRGRRCGLTPAMTLSPMSPSRRKISPRRTTPTIPTSERATDPGGRSSRPALQPGAQHPGHPRQHEVGHDRCEQHRRQQHAEDERPVGEARHEAERPRREQIRREEAEPDRDGLLPSRRRRGDRLLDRSGRRARPPLARLDVRRERRVEPSLDARAALDAHFARERASRLEPPGRAAASRPTPRASGCRGSGRACTRGRCPHRRAPTPSRGSRRKSSRDRCRPASTMSLRRRGPGRCVARSRR